MSDDFMSLRGSSSEDDDLLAAFSGSSSDRMPLPDSDPFASLDVPVSDKADPFADLSAPTAVPDVFGEDIFADTAPAAPTASVGRPGAAAAGADERPAWLRELSGFEEAQPAQPSRARASQPEAERRPAKKRGGLNLTGTGPQGRAFGMTAQQRMILSIFLFLNVTVLGLALLVAIGAVNF